MGQEFSSVRESIALLFRLLYGLEPLDMNEYHLLDRANSFLKDGISKLIFANPQGLERILNFEIRRVHP